MSITVAQLTDNALSAIDVNYTVLQVHGCYQQTTDNAIVPMYPPLSPFAHTYTHTHTHACMHTRMHTHAHTHTHIHTHTHTHPRNRLVIEEGFTALKLREEEDSYFPFLAKENFEHDEELLEKMVDFHFCMS